MLPQRESDEGQNLNISQPNAKDNEVLTSCPANVFQNYSNVFAEITKNVIGEIADSDTE